MWTGSGATGIRRVLGALAVTLAFVGLGVGLSGCPVAARLENEDRFDILREGPVDCNQPLPDGPSVVGCGYDALVRKHCASSGCHNRAAAADLDLTPDPLLIARILEVPSQHRIDCPGVGQCDLATPQCDRCTVCPPDDLLLNKTNVAESWIIRKMERFNVDTPNTAQNFECGSAMPLAPGNSGFTAETRTCLTDFFTWIANNGRKCDIPAGGSGGSGGASGAGSGGLGGT
jgi:hypothetical protein